MSRRDKLNDAKAMRLAEGVAKGVKRNDAELAATELLRLPADQRGPWLDPVATLLLPAVTKAQAGRDVGRLHAWAVRLTAEPRLLDACGGAVPATAWALAWGALQSRDWPRGRWLLLRAIPDLDTSPDPATTALAAWVAAQGEPAADAFVASLPPALATALAGPTVPGQGPAPPALSAPATPAEAEAAVLRAVATLSWSGWTATVLRWCAQAEAAVAAAIAAPAARLAVVEALRRAASAWGHPAGADAGPGNGRAGHWGDAVAWLADLARTLQPAELPLAEVATAVRLAQIALPAKVSLDQPPPRGLEAALHLVVRTGTLVGMAMPLFDRADLAGLDVDGPGLTTSWIDLVTEVCTATKDPNACWFALRLLAAERDAAGPAVPPRLADAIRDAIRHPAAWTAAWLALDDAARDDALVGLETRVPIDLAAAAIDACWDAVPPSERQRLAKAVGWLVERSSVRLPDRVDGERALYLHETALMARRLAFDGMPSISVYFEVLDRVGPELPSTQAVEEFCRSNRTVLDGGKASAAGRALWQRFQARCVPLGSSELEMALRLADGDGATREILALWFRHRPTHGDIHECRDVVDDVTQDEFGLFDGVLALSARDTAAGAAGALLYASCQRRPVAERRAWARSLQGLLDEHVGERTAEIEEAATEAAILLAKVPASKAKPSRKASSAPPEAKAKPARSAPTVPAAQPSTVPAAQPPTAPAAQRPTAPAAQPSTLPAAQPPADQPRPTRARRPRAVQPPLPFEEP